MTDYKNLKPSKLRKMFADVDFITEPRHHQLVSFAFGLDKNRNRVAFVHDVGTGKTLTALYMAMLWRAKRILVVAPSSIVRKTWAPQIEQHTTWTYKILDGKIKDRIKKLGQKARIYVINYEGLQWIYGKKESLIDPDTEEELDKNRIVVNRRSFVDDFDCIIFDEVHKLKGRKGIRRRIAKQLTKRSTFVIGLTGTPFNKLEDLWAEYEVLDQGQTFGRSFWAFRELYFRPYGPFKWVPKDGAKEKLLKKISWCTLRYEKRECLDLPPQVYEVRTARPTKEQQDAMMELQGYAEEAREEQNFFLAGQLAQKEQQICSGFILSRDDAGKQVTTRLLSLKKNPKIQLMLEVLEEIRGKVIIVHLYIEEGRLIEEALKKHGFTYRSLRGEIKNKDTQFFDWAEKEKYKCLVMHPASGGEGINAQMASNMIFINRPPGAIDNIQVEGRIHRDGQIETCTYFDLVLEGTVDEITSKRAGNERDNLQKFLDMLSRRKYGG